jgi:hypothetical protein
MPDAEKVKLFDKLNKVLELFPEDFRDLLQSQKLLMYELRQLPGTIRGQYAVFHVEHLSDEVIFSAGTHSLVSLRVELYHEWFDNL